VSPTGLMPATRVQRAFALSLDTELSNGWSYRDVMGSSSLSRYIELGPTPETILPRMEVPRKAI